MEKVQLIVFSNISNNIENIKRYTYKEINILNVTNQITGKELLEVIKSSDGIYTIFVREQDEYGIDSIRLLVEESRRSNADIVFCEHLEKDESGIYFPNRIFNQKKVYLKNQEIIKVLEKFKELDYSWKLVYGHLYRTQILIEILKKTEIYQGKFNEIWLNFNSLILGKTKVISSVKNNYYIYNRLPFKVKENDYFSPRYVQIKGELQFEDLKERILSDEIKIISFDVFDTLICRPFLYPQDVFILLNQYLYTLIDSIDGVEFQMIRAIGEEQARLKARRCGDEDINIDQIYEEIGKICTCLKPYVNLLKEKEKELEIQYCYPRETGRELYELALYLKKKVIFISDMYLPKATLSKMLEKCGILAENIFVSGEYKRNKGEGTLYEIVISNLGCKAEEILHIGDNGYSDVNMAREKGLQACHLPKPEELFNNWNPYVHTGKYFSKMFESRWGVVQNYDSKELLGIRCMMAVCANKLFDYPYIFVHEESDFNGNPYVIGYFTLGMHIYAISRWLLDNTINEKYDHLHFMARDGFLVKKAFDILNSIWDVDVKTYYTYMTRKSTLPLTIQSEIDCVNLMNSFNGTKVTPEKVFDIIKGFTKELTEEEKKFICKECQLDYRSSIGEKTKFLQLSDKIAKRLFDKEKVEKFKKDFEEQFGKQFKGKIASFDLGYSARVENILKSNFDYDITANYIHTTLDKANQRKVNAGVQVNTFYDFVPFISGIVREMMMSNLEGSCIGYDFSKEKVEILEHNNIDVGTYYTIAMMQSAALEFVEDMKKIFGEYNKKLLIRNYDASIPFDYYLNYSTKFDRSLFSMTKFEDDMGLGNGIGFEEFWDKMIIRMEKTKTVNYDNYGKIRKILLIILCGDLGELKRRISIKLHYRGVLYRVLRKSYKIIKLGFGKVIHRK